MAKHIGIIGGGIIGLSSAYYLTQAGHKVTIIDKGDLLDGCSMGNAGMIVPSHIIPLAAPGMISKGIRWMFNSSSPFYIKPRFESNLLRWGYLFYRSATRANVAKAAPALKELSLLSKSLYQEWSKTLPFDFGFHQRGLLMLYKTAEAEKEERETAQLANKYGVEARILSGDEVQDLEPDVRVRVRGGVFFPGDAHLTPQQLIPQLISFLRSQGVELCTGMDVTDIHLNGRTIKEIKTAERVFQFDEVVIATGAWSGEVARKLNLNLPMQAGKGYSFTLDGVARNTRIPSIFIESRVAVTPMGNSLRFGGTMEITGIDHSINLKRVEGIVNSIQQYYPDMKVNLPEPASIWHGLRPCSPDGLPYIGRVRQLDNLIIATGHSMMGLSLGPATGKIVSELVAEAPPSISVDAFVPDRFR